MLGILEIRMVLIVRCLWRIWTNNHVATSKKQLNALFLFNFCLTLIQQ